MQPAAMAPRAPARKAAAVTKTKPTRELMPGDLICAECGEGNAPTRKFCSRCGSSLEHAATAHIPWWRRLLPKRKSKVMAAGERPWRGADGKPKAPKKPLLAATRRVRKLLAVLAFIAGIIYAASPSLRENVNERVTSVKDKVMSIIRPQYDPIAPTNRQANFETPEHPGGNAVDLRTNTFWAAPLSSPEPVLVLTFANEVNLDRAIIHNGAEEGFRNLNRPRVLLFVYSNNQSFQVELKDTPEEQQIELKNGHGITSVEIHVVDQTPAVPPADMALSEIELFTQR